MPNINKFSAINHNATTPIEIQIEEALEEVSKDPYGSNGLKTALAFIKSQAELFESFTSCSQIIGCQETARKTILKLVLTEWEIYGLGKKTTIEELQGLPSISNPLNQRGAVTKFFD